MKTKIKYSQEVIFLHTQYLIQPEAPQVPPYAAEQIAQGLAEQLAIFLFPLLVTLDQLLDKRLVRTFLQTIQVIIAYRDRVGGLLLSELGGYRLEPGQGKLLVERLLVWGRSVVHIFDQGFASAFWLGVLLAFGLRFVLGFRADYQLFDAQGNRAPRLAHRHRQAWVVGAHHLGQSPRPVGSSQRARPAGDASRSSRHTAVARGLPRASDALPGIS